MLVDYRSMSTGARERNIVYAMLGLLSSAPLWLVVVVLAALALWRLPAYGHKILRFLRDLRDYRAGR